MKYLMGEMSNGSAKLLDTYPRGMGRCFREKRLNPFYGEPWVLDNGAFPVWNQNDRDPATDYTDVWAYFESRLERVSDLTRQGRGPLFIGALDRPGHAQSLDTTLDWLDRWEEEMQYDLDPVGAIYGVPTVPIYAAVQDGMTPEALVASGVLDRVQGLFLGGSDGFKATAPIWRALTRELGLGFHYARCTQSRIAEAVELQCDSADSSHPCRLTGARWARFLEVFDQEMHHDDDPNRPDPAPTPQAWDLRAARNGRDVPERDVRRRQRARGAHERLREVACQRRADTGRAARALRIPARAAHDRLLPEVLGRDVGLPGGGLMEPEEFTRLRKAMGYSNSFLARALGRSRQTVLRYQYPSDDKRNSRVPNAVQNLMRHWAKQQEVK